MFFAFLGIKHFGKNLVLMWALIFFFTFIIFLKSTNSYLDKYVCFCNTFLKGTSTVHFQLGIRWFLHICWLVYNEFGYWLYSAMHPLAKYYCFKCNSHWHLTLFISNVIKIIGLLNNKVDFFKQSFHLVANIQHRSSVTRWLTYFHQYLAFYNNEN